MYKRFEYIAFDGFTDHKAYITPYEVANLLNEFYEENKSLKDFINQLQEELVLFKEAGANMGVDLNAQIATLKEENEQLKKENMEYHHLVNCGNCKYHNYDWFDDGEEFEICEKGYTERLMYNKFCKEWRELE